MWDWCNEICQLDHFARYLKVRSTYHVACRLSKGWKAALEKIYSPMVHYRKGRRLFARKRGISCIPGEALAMCVTSTLRSPKKMYTKCVVKWKSAFFERKTNIKRRRGYTTHWRNSQQTTYTIRGDIQQISVIQSYWSHHLRQNQRYRRVDM